MATPIRTAAAAAPPARPPPPLPPQPHHDTTLTLALALPRDGFVARVRSSLTVDTRTPPCSECGKQFASPKALFGHMRCHPERQWRGMTPTSPHFRHQALLQFTDQERETATSLLMLRGARTAGAAKGKKSNLGAPPPSAKLSCGASTSASSPMPTATTTAPAPPPRCDDHKCGVCARGFATGQALGGHKRCHWEKTTCAEGTMAVATSSPTSSSQAAPATTLDLNLPPPGMPPTLDLKLGL